MMRLDKFLCEMGVGSRSEVKNELKKAQITVNGEIEKRPDRKIDENKDVICFQKQQLRYAAYEYVMLYKPAGVLSATEDRKAETVLDLLGSDVVRNDLFPVGRLDKDTEGLLLLTNDGALAHQLLSPKKHVDKVYYAKVEGCMPAEAIKLFEEGMDIGDEKRTLPAKLKILSACESGSEVKITLREGRFHQVKRMCEAVGCPVTFLKRLSMGSLQLDESLKPGEYRSLTEEELAKLQNEP